MLRVVLFLQAISLLVVNVHSTTDWANSPLYILGCAKGVEADRVRGLSKNIQRLLSTLKDPKLGNVILYSDLSSKNAFLSSNSSPYSVIDDVYNHHVRTFRITMCRNTLLRKVAEMIALKNERAEDVHFIMIDLDGVNDKQFNMTVFNEVTRDLNQWQALSFNRPTYYDLWALRYKRIDINVWNARDPGTAIKALQNDIKHELSIAENPYFPVYSAFNGIAIYQYNYTLGCEYDGRELGRPGPPEDCEHVTFHKCMIDKNNATVVIYKHSLVLQLKVE